MPTDRNPVSHTTPTAAPTAKAPGQEPLPGYRLLEPLGRGGFGEVWKCEAPGGLHKAVKFVAQDPDDPSGGHSLRQEFEAFQQIKAIRHPFLLTLERVELVDGELVMVMELADQHLQDRFCECAALGLPGIPRDELIGYMAEAAEALDVISTKYGLQHLDVKPANLFVTSGHAKVGDYGLVARFEASGAKSAGRSTRGLTPRYVAPEVIKGQVDARSDQYSLALVYVEMLTGGFPFSAKNAPQMLMQHAAAAPDLSALDSIDRDAVARALAKAPADRYPSCLDFVRALLGSSGQSPGILRTSGGIRVPRPVDPPPEPPTTRPTYRRDSKTPPKNPHPTMRVPVSPIPTAPAVKLPPLTAVPRLTPPHLRVPGLRSTPAAPPVDDDAELIALEVTPALLPAEPTGGRFRAPGRVVTKLDRIWSVMSDGRLIGASDDPPHPPSASEFVEAVVRAAAGGGVLPRSPGDPFRSASGRWAARLLVKAVPAVVKLKLSALAETTGAELTQPDPQTFVFRVFSEPAGVWARWSGKKGGLEVTVRLPHGGPLIGEADLDGNIFGTPDAGFAALADDAIPKLMDDIRRSVGHVEEKRKFPRVPLAIPIRVYPVTGDGCVFPGWEAVGRDVSVGGVRFATDVSTEMQYAFIGFDRVADLEGWCVLTKLIRAKRVAGGHEYAGRFRTDL